MEAVLTESIRKSGICYLCGLAGADTTEHVLPRCLYPEPRRLPSDVLTLPAHLACNRHTHQHEEAFRDFIAAGIAPNSPGHALWERTWRAIHRPEAKGRQQAYYKDILSRYEPDEQGNPVAYPIAVTLKDERVHWVLSKIVKGLFVYVTGGLLLDRNVVWSFGQLRQGGDSAVHLPNSCNLHDVLAVRWGFATDQPLVTIWTFDFYATHCFHVTTAPTELHAREHWPPHATQLVWPGPASAPGSG